jgi:hypothetical protein
MAIKNQDYIKKGNDNLNIVQDVIDTNAQINGVPTKTGLFNTILNRTKFIYNKPEAAYVRESHGAYIVMGQVPLGATETTGYGALGLPAESIDLVVGRNSTSNRGKGPKQGEVVNNNHMTDAARIYISRLTDIDAAFNLATDSKKISRRGLVSRSAIGIKADGIRIIGREGVKIVTGKVFTKDGGEERNSLNGKILPAPPIELIAGNNYKNVQGVAMGDRTSEALRELNDLVGEIWSAVFNLALIQAGFNGVVGVNVLPWIAGASPPTNLGIYTKVLNSLYHTRTSASLWEFNYLNSLGGEYIVSTNVRTN